MNIQRIAERERARLVRARSLVLRKRRDRRVVGERADGLSFRLPRLPSVLGLVRHELRRWLEREGVTPEAAADIILACSEACANAMEHPQATESAAFEVGVSLHRGEIELAVRDFGSWDPDEKAEGDARGRGIEMIRSLMDEVSIVKGSEGTEVTMRRRVAPSA